MKGKDKKIPKQVLSIVASIVLAIAMCGTTVQMVYADEPETGEGVAAESGMQVEQDVAEEAAPEEGDVSKDAVAEDTDEEMEQLGEDGEVVEYPLWVGGRQVTSANADNIKPAEGYTRYSGKASYDKDTNTLTLDNYVYEGVGRQYYYSFSVIHALRLDNLTISLKGDNYIKQVGGGSDYTQGSLGIFARDLQIKDDPAEGTGSLTIDATGFNGQGRSYGMEVYSLTITGGKVVANGYEAENYSAGVKVEYEGGLNITGGSLIATAKPISNDTGVHNSSGVWVQSGNFTIGRNVDEVTVSGYTKAINGGVINELAGTGWTDVDGTEGETEIAVSSESRSLDYKKVHFEAVAYPLWVGGRQVTSANADNIKPAEGYTRYSGKASYDKDTNTLTLDNYVYEGVGRQDYRSCSVIHALQLDNLTISLKGDNYIKQVGGGSNYIQSSLGIFASDLEIKDDPAEGTGSLTIDATGFNGQGISYGMEVYSLTITGGKVVANGYEAENYSAGVNAKSEGGLNITGGSLIATAKPISYDTGINNSSGVWLQSGNFTIGRNVDEVTVSGYTKAINGGVINELAGTGWTDVDGTEGEAKIAVSSESRGLDYKKVQFISKDESAADVPLAMVVAKGTRSLVFSWDEVEGADGYNVFYAKCGKKSKYKKITVKGGDVTTVTKTKLSKGKGYKMYVRAWTMQDGVKTYISKTPVMHAYTRGYTKKYTNPKDLILTESETSLETGSTYTIEADIIKLKTKKKLAPKSHGPQLRYISSDEGIATVSSSGEVTANAKGSCVIYVYTLNGISKELKVTVK